VVKLNYLTMTRPNIAYFVIVVSQFLSTPRTSYWDAVILLFWYQSMLLAEAFCIQIMVMGV